MRFVSTFRQNSKICPYGESTRRDESGADYITRRALIKRFAAATQDAHARGNILYILPIDLVSRGICLEPSGAGKDYTYVNSFIQPLYIPLRHVAFIAGGRVKNLRGGEAWRISGDPAREAPRSERGPEESWSALADDTPNESDQLFQRVVDEVIPHLRTISKPADVPDILRAKDYVSHLDYEKIGYSLILAHLVSEGVSELQKALAIVSLEPKLREFDLECQERCRLILSLLASDSRKAESKLYEWAIFTARHAKVPSRLLRLGNSC